MRSILLSLPFLLLTLSPVANADRNDDPNPATNEAGVDRRCEAKIDRAAGRYARCLLKAKARAARDQEQDVEETNEAEAECREDFDEAVDRALARHQEDNCTPFIAQMEERTASYAEAMALEAAGVPALELLFVQSSDGGTLTDTKLTLLGVNAQTGWFSDRPYRRAGQITTAEFVALFFEEGANSFAEDPPNADFTCESGGEVVNQVVTLTEPVLDEAADTLTYTTAFVPTAGDDDSSVGITCDADAHLFIDPATATASARSCHAPIIGEGADPDTSEGEAAACAAAAQCLIDNCLNSCITDPTGAECTDCIQQNGCNPGAATASARFEACTDGVTVADNETGLLWERKTTSGDVHDVGNTYSWSSGGTAADGTAYTAFLATLNTAPDFAGHTDWRLPFISELQSILVGQGVTIRVTDSVDPPDPAMGTNPTGQSTTCSEDACIDPDFAAIGGPTASSRESNYWSASSNSIAPFLAWAAYFDSGDVDSTSFKPSDGFVRAVRAGSCSS